MNLASLRKPKKIAATALVVASTLIMLPVGAEELSFGQSSSDARFLSDLIGTPGIRLGQGELDDLAHFTDDLGFDNNSVYQRLNAEDDRPLLGGNTNVGNKIPPRPNNRGTRATFRLSNPSLYWE